MGNKVTLVFPDGTAVEGDEGACRSCQAPIVWIVTKNGKRAPMNLDGTSHFGTCPQSESWRRK